VVEGCSYLELLWEPSAFERAATIDFAWRGSMYRMRRPEALGDVHFLRVLGDDFDDDPLELVLVRKRGSWESLKRLARRSQPVVLESEAEAERVG
jgi:hypothetical protein